MNLTIAMNPVLILKFIHMVGVIVWVGSTLTIGMLAAMVESKSSFAGPARKLSHKLTNPAMGLTWVCGLAMLAINWSVYARAGWMHGKLLLVLIASAITGIIGVRLKKIAAGEDHSLKGLVIGLFVVMILIVAAVILGPSLLARS